MSKMPMSERLFIGTFAGGISYADRGREVNGDYAKLAFLPYGTLELEWHAKKPPPELRAEILTHARKMQARAGEEHPLDASGHTITLGHKLKKASAKPSVAQIERDLAAITVKPSRSYKSPGLSRNQGGLDLRNELDAAPTSKYPPLTLGRTTYRVFSMAGNDYSMVGPRGGTSHLVQSTNNPNLFSHNTVGGSSTWYVRNADGSFTKKR